MCLRKLSRLQGENPLTMLPEEVDVNGVHDMGGMHGFGPVQPEENEPVFHEPWEGRLYAMMRSIGRQRVFGHVGMRFKLESLPPAQYLASSYYDRWMTVLEQALVEKGILDRNELEMQQEFFHQNSGAQPTRAEDPDAVETAAKLAYNQQSPLREIDMKPMFSAGDTIRARNIHPVGHCRLPRYIRGKRGTVDRFRGIYDFDDSRSRGDGPDSQPVYSVRFEGSELWGDAAEPNSVVYIDMWEAYLNPA